MAQLALAGAGAVIGSAVGMPYLGFALGSMLGGVLFPQDGPPDQIQEGPRLHDLKVQSSAHGAMLPLVYGTVRIAGNVIWAADLEEQVVTETTSASGVPRRRCRLKIFCAQRARGRRRVGNQHHPQLHLFRQLRRGAVRGADCLCRARLGKRHAGAR
jgi:hypothetical protein